jgi:uncharacterized membrane protein
MAFYYALENAKAAIVVPSTEAYPLLTVILAVVAVRAKLSFIRGLGVLLAILAVVLISTK